MTPGPPRPAPTSTLIVDGLEGRVARVELEDGSVQDWPLASLPRGVREGDVLRLHVEDGDLSLKIDREAAREHRHCALAALDALNADDAGGEITL